MAQLIKLQNYISRYEDDIFHYPAQYTRLKKREWGKFYDNWLQQANSSAAAPGPLDENWLVEEKPAKRKWFQALRPKKKEPRLKSGTQPQLPFNEAEADFMTVSEDAKKLFLEKMYDIQLSWASSSRAEVSALDHRFFVDERLKFLMKQWPDTFLILYKPIFKFKKALVELDVIVVTPIEIWCIAFLEEQDNAVFIGRNDRFWTKRLADKETKQLSPALSLSRTEAAVKKILSEKQLHFPVKKAILSRNGYINDEGAGRGTFLIDRRSFSGWLQSLKSLSSPLKTNQLIAAKALLAHTDTVSSSRPEREEGELK